MPKWTPYISGERAVVVGGDYIYCYALTHEESVKFVAAHNADIDALTAERDEWQSRCESMVAKRTLAKHRNVKMWKVPAIGESLIDIGTDQCVMVGGRFWREDLVIAHNNDIIALNHCADILADVISGLTAERDELQRRLAEVVVKISEAVVSDDDCVCSMLCHSAIRAIAEGRDNG